MFTFMSSHPPTEREKSSKLSISSSSYRTNIPPTPSRDMQEYDSAYIVKLNDFVDRACMIPTVLGHIPEPRSQFCIWKSVIRAVAMSQDTLMELSFDGDVDTDDLDIHVQRELSNPTSFPSQVARVCAYVFVGLVFPSVDDMLIHARECIDTVLFALLSICRDHVTQDQRIMAVLTSSIDRFMLTLYEDVMYIKIMSDIKRSTQVNLPESNPERIKSTHFPENWRAKCVVLSTRIALARAPADKLFHLIKILQYVSKLAAASAPSTPRSKPTKSTNLEPSISNMPASLESIPEGTKSQETTRNQTPQPTTSEKIIAEIHDLRPAPLVVLEGVASPMEDIASPTVSYFHSASKGERHLVLDDDEIVTLDAPPDSDDEIEDSDDDILDPPEQNGWITYNRNVAALFEVTSEDMLSPQSPRRDRDCDAPAAGNEAKEEGSTPSGYSAVMVPKVPEKTADTDRLLQVFAHIIYVQQKEGVIDWISECRFLSSAMISPDAQIMNGPHGYALVTLQQALYCLVQGDYEYLH